jgi:hypothetical protein
MLMNIIGPLVKLAQGQIQKLWQLGQGQLRGFPHVNEL